MRRYLELREVGSPRNSDENGERRPVWRTAAKTLGCCCVCAIFGCTLIVGLGVMVSQTFAQETAPTRTVAVTPAKSIPPAAMEVMTKSVRPETKTKVAKITSSLEAALSSPQMPEGMTMTREELAKAAQLVKEGVAKDGSVISAFQDVQAAAAMSQPLGAAAAHGALLTDEDLKELSGGAPGIMEGEEHQLQSQLGQGEHGPETVGHRLRRLADGRVAAGRTWPGGIVKYCFAPDLSERTQAFFRLAKDAWMKAVPCLTFTEVGWKSGDRKSFGKCQEEPAIFVGNDGTGCWSMLGMTGGSQPMSFAEPGCLWIGTIEHELGHALGMSHEQCRPDRDQFITVQWQNIPGRKWQSQFDIMRDAFTDLPYDYLSVMHYGTRKTRPWFTLPSSVDASKVGQRTALSDGDIAQMVVMYESEVAGGCSGGGGIVGCVDAPGSHCESASRRGNCSQASRDELKNCCACDGGFEVKCYKRAGCPNVTASGIDQVVDMIPGKKPSFVTEHLPSGKRAAAALLPLLFVLAGLLACVCCCGVLVAFACPVFLL